jgi:hypothetical protein
LTQKSLNRRTNLGITLTDQDAPIEPTYIQNIKNLGFTVTDYSKWLNGVAVNATSAQNRAIISAKLCGSRRNFVRNPSGGIRKKKLTNSNNLISKAPVAMY